MDFVGKVKVKYFCSKFAYIKKFWLDFKKSFLYIIKKQKGQKHLTSQLFKGGSST